ncbi:hypothetical protein FOPE_10850 [Fonsecaea pedrosoi]|nr:hypothetical protein FOPE_10850 [Fonsecaea pedrosoi]
MKVSMDLKVITNTTVVWAALNIVVTDALVLQPHVALRGYRSAHERLRQDVLALSMCGNPVPVHVDGPELVRVPGDGHLARPAPAYVHHLVGVEALVVGGVLAVAHLDRQAAVSFGVAGGQTKSVNGVSSG